MLDSLDTLIAFALIFLVVSLLITIVVQMISSALNLRGKNLAWGISEAFEAIAPTLAGDVKTSAAGWKERAVNGIKNLPSKFFPQQTAAKKLAGHCLNDTLISDFQLFGMHWAASAVRPDELFDLLHRIATNKKPGTPDDIKQHVLTLFKSLGVPESVFTVSAAEQIKLHDLKTNLGQAVQNLPAGPAQDAVNTAFGEASAKLVNLTTDATACAGRWAAQGEDAIKGIYQKFEHWFETGQERSQEWFTTHARIITGILGLFFALVLQLDTIEVFKTVSSNREMRDKLVAQSASVLKQAEHTLGDTNIVLKTALDNWRAALQPADKIPAALKEIKAEPSDTRGTLIAKAESTLTGMDTKVEWRTSLGDAIDKAAQSDVKERAADYRSVATSLEKTGFDLFPGWRWGTSQKPAEGLWHWAGSKVDWIEGLRGHGLYVHRWGVLASTLLLSLGAPFWFNTLKSLASLRSNVAGNISDEKKVEQKEGKAGKPGVPPPTV